MSNKRAAKTNAQRQAEWRARNPPKGRKLAACPSRAAAVRHQRKGDECTDPEGCAQAIRDHNAAQASKRASKRASKPSK